jgi:hydroxyethylthiazole kinase-like uncharacterized protein yjeF
MHALTRKQIQKLDQDTMNHIGIPGIVLMENAGSQVAHFLMKENPHRLPTLILCGKGNNGGDGSVLARYLWNHHYPVTLVLLAEPQTLTASALLQWNILNQLPLKPTPLQLPPSEFQTLLPLWKNHPIHVDALFGIGLHSPLHSPYLELITQWNQIPAFKVALDLPSGLCANTGQELGVAFRAHHTYTFIAPKIGFFLNKGPECVGKLKTIDIGIPYHLSLPSP